MWQLALVAVLVLSLLVWFYRESTCLVVYGDAQDWTAFIAAFRSVIPMAEVVVLKPEADFVAYTDALAQCAGRFKNLVCQVPNSLAARLVAGRPGTTVSIAAQPDLVKSSVTCNIVASEQMLVDRLLSFAPDTGKKLLLSEAACRLPPGWTQVQTDVDSAIQKLSGLKLGVVVISNPKMTTPANIAAIRAAFPGVYLAGATVDEAPVSELACQVCINRQGAGRLAAGLCRMHETAGMYTGQKTVVVDPVVVSPSTGVDSAAVTELSRLRNLL